MGDTDGAKLQPKMGKIKYTLGATIPVMSFGNLQPSIEAEADTFEEAQALVEPKMLALWDKYNPGVLSTGSYRKLLKDFFGNEIYYDETTHTYTNEAGEVYESGSKYADTFRKPFDKEKIAKLMADKIKADPKDIIAMWELKAQASRDFGNAIHAALQLYEQYNGLASALGKTTHAHEHPVIKNAVDGFMEAHKDETAESEVLVVDHENKRAGRIDRLLKTATTYRVQDFKTNADIDKELDIYWHQLQFYADIIKANGKPVGGLDIFHYNGSWKTYNHEVI